MEASRACLAGLFAACVQFTSPVLADELGRPPATLDVAGEVRPIEIANRSEESTSENGGRQSRPRQSTAQWSSPGVAVDRDTSNAWKLRWRKSSSVSPTVEEAKPAQTTTTVVDAKPLAVARAVVWNQIDDRASYRHFPVRQASQLAPVDPFEEPYPGQPADKVERRVSERTNTFNILQPRPMPPVTAPSETADDSTQPVPMPAEPVTPESAVPMGDRDSAPVPPLNLGNADPSMSPVPRSVPCDRIYNDRNCCEGDKNCKKAKEIFMGQEHKITNIRLDITPRFTNTDNPETAGFVPTEVRKEESLSKAPSRTWKNRAGATVAEGRFTDYRNGLVHVLTENGEKLELAYNELSDDDTCFVTAWWSLPGECLLADESFQQRNWLATTMTWKASALCHKPLYFEEVALERYGHSVGPIKQPFVSGAHFFGSLAALPYQMGIHPPNECVYALGYYRPGSCAPWLVPPFPVSLRGALLEAGVWVGGIYIVP